jgi:hypothetical protein
MNVSDLLNPTDEPDGEIRHPGNVEIDMTSRSFQATESSSEDLFPFDAAQG